MYLYSVQQQEILANYLKTSILISVFLVIFPLQYHANELLPLKDEQVVAKVLSCLSKCIKDFDNASVIDKEIERFPKSLTHFFPGGFFLAYYSFKNCIFQKKNLCSCVQLSVSQQHRTNFLDHALIKY